MNTWHWITLVAWGNFLLVLLTLHAESVRSLEVTRRLEALRKRVFAGMMLFSAIVLGWGILIYLTETEVLPETQSWHLRMMVVIAVVPLMLWVAVGCAVALMRRKRYIPRRRKPSPHPLDRTWPTQPTFLDTMVPTPDQPARIRCSSAHSQHRDNHDELVDLG